MLFTDTTLVFIGMIGIMTLYMGGQALITNQRTYRWYTAYALCWVLYFIIRVYDVFDGTRFGDSIAAFARVGFPMLAYVCYYSFANVFVNLQERLPAIYRLFRRMQVVLLIYTLLEAVLCFGWPGWGYSAWHEAIHTVVRVGIAIASLLGIWQLSRRRDVVINYLLVGSSLLLFLSLLSMLMSLTDTSQTGESPFWEAPLFYMQTGIVLELLCFALGLSYQYKLTEVQKATAEQALLLEREQHKVAQLRTHFFTNVSHEFRTPLTLILGPLTTMVKAEPTNRAFQLMHRQATRLLTLVNQLLDLNKLDAGQLTPDLQPGPLRQFIKGLAGSFASLADSQDIRLLVDAADTLPETARYDPDKLEKIVTNLLSNALKFTPAGGQVSLTCSYAGDQVTFQVTDTGPGISSDQQAQVFERFYQSPHTATGGGTGIGLALVQELIAVLNGHIQLISKPGQGAIFIVTLPISVPEDKPARQATPTGVTIPLPRAHLAPTDSQPEPASLTELPQLLLIDDNTDVRHYLRLLFTDDYRLLEAPTGKIGLALADECLPDLVICDLMMPDMDGLAFCHAMRQQDATDHIPVILLTAKADVDSRIVGLQHGADDYLTKPFHPFELQTRVKNLLAQRRRLRDRFSQQILHLKPADILIPSLTEQFLQRAISVVEKHMANSAFDVETLSQELNLSRMQLHRKLKTLTNQSATEFVRSLRLQRAADLLRQRSASVSEVAYSVGFESLSYFTKAFREQFGLAPSEY